MPELTTAEKNKIIAETLFGLKVIYPRQYFDNLKGKNADYYRQQADYRGDAPIVVRNNKPLKTHSIDAYPAPDFYIGVNSYELLARARQLLFERNLHLRFAEILAESFEPPEFWKNLHWNLINAAPGAQADAIVKTLVEKKDE